MPVQHKDRTAVILGNVYGRWAVLKVVDRPVNRHGRAFVCRCVCGKERLIREKSLIGYLSNIMQCVCYKASTRHGKSGSREFSAWRGLRNRCYQRTIANFHCYGGRGIKVCDSWQKSFETFYSDMGKCPEGYELDRIDTDGDYEPGNCRWVPPKVNARNRRTCRYIEYDGRRLAMSEWAEILGMEPMTLKGRLDAGWGVERAFTQPVEKTNRDRGKFVRAETQETP